MLAVQQATIGTVDAQNIGHSGRIESGHRLRLRLWRGSRTDRAVVPLPVPYLDRVGHRYGAAVLLRELARRAGGRRYQEQGPEQPAAAR